MEFAALVDDLISSAPINRLQGIRHFGAFELENWRLLLTPAEPIVVSRYVHTMGVARIAQEASADFTLSARQYNVLYAILHDVGHGPFSHSTEGVFRHLGIDHHEAFERHVLSGTNGSIGSILRDHHVDITEFLSFSRTKSHYNLFSYPINPDLLDGLRLSAEILLGYDDLKSLDLVASLREPEAHTEILDAVWRQKEKIYLDVINSPRWKNYDLVFEFALYRIFDRLTLADFFLDDQQFLEKHGKAMRGAISSPQVVSELERSLVETSRTNQAARSIYVDRGIALVGRESMRRRYVDVSGMAAGATLDLGFDTIYPRVLKL